jgi:hypothetical protein
MISPTLDKPDKRLYHTFWIKHSLHRIAGTFAAPTVERISLKCSVQRWSHRVAPALSTLPCDWRTAYITPIHKSGNRLEANNYRPISLTSSVVKIMESIIVDKLDSFTSEFAIIPKEQCGFRKGKSVETNLLFCLNDWSSLIDLDKY